MRGSLGLELPKKVNLKEYPYLSTFVHPGHFMLRGYGITCLIQNIPLPQWLDQQIMGTDL